MLPSTGSVACSASSGIAVSGAGQGVHGIGKVATGSGETVSGSGEIVAGGGDAVSSISGSLSGRSKPRYSHVITRIPSIQTQAIIRPSVVLSIVNEPTCGVFPCFGENVH